MPHCRCTLYNQKVQPEMYNQKVQPEMYNQKVQPEMYNQKVQPEMYNQKVQPEMYNQKVQPEMYNQKVQPEMYNQKVQPEIYNQKVQPEMYNQKISSGSGHVRVGIGWYSAAMVQICGDSSTAAAVPTAYMKISWGGKTHQIQVLDGAEGREKFINDCRRLLEIPENVKFDIVYHCGDLTLRGMGAYDAAFYCAAASNASTTVGRSSTRKVSNPESAPSPPSSTTPTSTPTAAQAPTPAQAEGDGVLAHSSRRVRQAAAPSNMGMKKKLMNSLKAAVCLGM
eukprot:gene10196-8109_t